MALKQFESTVRELITKQLYISKVYMIMDMGGVFRKCWVLFKVRRDYGSRMAVIKSDIKIP